ncbi:MAG: hypothetical protein PF489_02035 [Salinivirgaceae bacterium]|jgi:hypothetical protein|nr:hypothetical protein [Salinivirgaceae bacterium]
MRDCLLVFLFMSVGIYSAAQQGINSDYYKYGASPSALPEYLLNATGDSPVYLGISDPDVDSATGIAQALKRAETLLYLSNSAKSRSLHDYYLGEEYSGSGGTFQSFIQLDRIDSVFIPFTVIDTFFTGFNEVLIRIKPEETLDDLISFSVGSSYDISYEKYRMEYEWGGAVEFEDQTDTRFCFFGVDSSANTLSVFRYSNQFDVSSTTNDVTTYLPTLRYNYVESQPGKQQYFRYGLWVHYIDKLISLIGEESRRANEQIRKTEENYGGNTQLNQGIAANNLSFVINKITLSEGEVDLDIEVEFLRVNQHADN